MQMLAPTTRYTYSVGAHLRVHPYFASIRNAPSIISAVRFCITRKIYDSQWS